MKKKLLAIIASIKAEEDKLNSPIPQRPLWMGGTSSNFQPPSPPTPILPRVSSATLLLDLEADRLGLSDGDLVSIWADQSGNGRDFTQTGDARPTKQTVDGFPVVVFDGVDDSMFGSDFAGNAPLAIFIVADASNNFVIYKIGNDGCSDPGAKGWIVGMESIQLYEDTSKQFIQALDINPSGKHVFVAEIISNTELHLYVDGVLHDGYPDGGTDFGSGGVSDFSNSEPLRFNTDGSNGSCDGCQASTDYARMIYQITDPDNWVTDRAAITAWLANRYGIAL